MGVIGAIWGVLGVLSILVFAVARLMPVAVEAISMDLLWYHWVVLIGNTLFMMHSEGYRGFQTAFSPRVAARARYLLHRPTFKSVLLAPFFCIGYFDSSRRRKIVVYTLTIGILILIGLVRVLDQPWRGIIDAGVVVGLSWGFVATSAFVIYAFCSHRFEHDPEVITSSK